MKLSQTQKMLQLLSDGLPHRTDEILRIIYGSDHAGIARLSGRVSDLRAMGYDIPKAVKDKNNKTLYWYKMNVRIEAPRPVQTPVVQNNQVDLLNAVPYTRRNDLNWR